ncbi:MAG: hypothetical protein V1806_07930 [Pseudomonadota bacterium]
MSTWKPPRGDRQRVYYVLPAERLESLLGSEFAPLGPLADPEPLPAPDPSPAAGPSYGPRERPDAPRGFFLDRYVY